MINLVSEILKKENISYTTLTKAPSGFTNQVYFVEQSFVIKITKNQEIKKLLEKEVGIYKNVKLENIPKYVCSGEYFDYGYLIITK